MATGVLDFAFPFTDLPEDVQLCILSFLSPVEISGFACTSKRFATLCRDDGKIWYAMCDRRWGKKTQIHNWRNGRISYKLLYKTLRDMENLIGFWRLCGGANPAALSPHLILFEWNPSFVLGSRVLTTNHDSYHVQKTPFLLMKISPEGRSVNFLDIDGNSRSASDLTELEIPSGNIVPVDVNFMGNGHIMVEENRCFNYNLGEEQKSPVSKGSSSSGEESEDAITGTSPKFMVSEVYTQLANRTSPGGDRRRQRKKEKVRQAKTKWEPEHFIKVADCSPTPSKPLQGLWKGFCEERKLELYMVKYDEIGGIICRKVKDVSLSRAATSPVFWTSNPSLIKSPFSIEEEVILNGINGGGEDEERLVSGMLNMKSSYRGEGRVWLYENGDFGFGFLGDQIITDLRRVVLEDGTLADDLERLL